MNATTTLLALLLCICLFSQAPAQEENKGQLWYCYEETIKPEKQALYIELSKEMIELCKEHNFPFPIFTWTSGQFTYSLWSPINSLADIEKINEAWNAIVESWGEEKYAEFNSTKVKNYSYTVREIPGLQFEPENKRFTTDEIRYMEWNEFLVIPGKEKQLRSTIKRFIALGTSKNYNDPWYYYRGGVGMESPTIIAIRQAKSRLDAVEQDERFSEVFSDEFRKLRREFMSCVSSRVNKEFWWRKDLSYELVN